MYRAMRYFTHGFFVLPVFNAENQYWQAFPGFLCIEIAAQRKMPYLRDMASFFASLLR